MLGWRSCALRTSGVVSQQADYTGNGEIPTFRMKIHYPSLSVGHEGFGLLDLMCCYFVGLDTLGSLKAFGGDGSLSHQALFKSVSDPILLCDGAEVEILIGWSMVRRLWRSDLSLQMKGILLVDIDGGDILVSGSKLLVGIDETRSRVLVSGSGLSAWTGNPLAGSSVAGGGSNSGGSLAVGDDVAAKMGGGPIAILFWAVWDSLWARQYLSYFVTDATKVGFDMEGMGFDSAVRSCFKSDPSESDFGRCVINLNIGDDIGGKAMLMCVDEGAFMETCISVGQEPPPAKLD